MAARPRAMDRPDPWHHEAASLENIGAAGIELTREDLRDIDSALANITVQGERYPALARASPSLSGPGAFGLGDIMHSTFLSPAEVGEIIRVSGRRSVSPRPQTTSRGAGNGAPGRRWSFSPSPCRDTSVSSWALLLAGQLAAPIRKRRQLVRVIALMWPLGPNNSGLHERAP
jgi:hypothetical protein